jgi:hypothetical protein
MLLFRWKLVVAMVSIGLEGVSCGDGVHEWQHTRAEAWLYEPKVLQKLTARVMQSSVVQLVLSE